MSVESVARGDARVALLRYLRRRARGGEFYCKSKFIAEDLELSASQIGSLLGELSDAPEGPEVERWGYANATTWRVAPGE